MRPPLVSILIADIANASIANGPAPSGAPSSQATLLESVHSALEQTWPRCEILIVSPKPEPYEAALQRRSKRHEITLIEAPVVSAAQGYNLGIENSTGELLQFLPAGQILGAEKVSEQATLFGGGVRDRKLAMARHASFTQSTNDAQFSRAGIWSNRSGLEWVLEAWTHSYHPPLGAWCVPRSILADTGKFNEAFGDAGLDEALTRFVLAGEGVDFASSAVVYSRALGITHEPKTYYEQRVQALEKMVGWLLKVDDSKRSQVAAGALLEEFVYLALPYAPQAARSTLAKALPVSYSKFRGIADKKFQLVRTCLGWRSALRFRQWGLVR